MKADDFRTMTLEEIDLRVSDLKKQLFNSRMQLYSNQLQNTHKISNLKRDIARAQTVRNEKLAEAEQVS